MCVLKKFLQYTLSRLRKGQPRLLLGAIESSRPFSLESRVGISQQKHRVPAISDASTPNLTRMRALMTPGVHLVRLMIRSPRYAVNRGSRRWPRRQQSANHG